MSKKKRKFQNAMFLLQKIVQIQITLQQGDVIFDNGSCM